MSKNLLIVESPAKAKTIEKILGSDFEVKSCYGHIRDLEKDDMGIDLNNNYMPRYKVPDEKKKVVSKLNGLSLTFKAVAGESDKLFGAVTHGDISKELEKQGYSVDKRDVVLEEPIKILGKHKAQVKFSEGLVADISINVERQ